MTSFDVKGGVCVRDNLLLIAAQHYNGLVRRASAVRFGEAKELPAPHKCHATGKAKRQPQEASGCMQSVDVDGYEPSLPFSGWPSNHKKRAPDVFSFEAVDPFSPGEEDVEELWSLLAPCSNMEILHVQLLAVFRFGVTRDRRWECGSWTCTGNGVELRRTQHVY